MYGLYKMSGVKVIFREKGCLAFNWFTWIIIFTSLPPGIPNILRRLHEDLEFQLDSEGGSDHTQDNFDKTDLMETIHHWSRKLKLTLQKISSGGKKAVIVIDGLNMVDSPGKVGKVRDC